MKTPPAYGQPLRSRTRYSLLALRAIVASLVAALGAAAPAHAGGPGLADAVFNFVFDLPKSGNEVPVAQRRYVALQVCVPAQPNNRNGLKVSTLGSSESTVYSQQTAVSGGQEPLYEGAAQLLPDGLLPYHGRLVVAQLSAPWVSGDEFRPGTLWFLWRPLEHDLEKTQGWTPWLRPAAVTGHIYPWARELQLEASLPLPQASPLMRFRVISAAQYAELSARMDKMRPQRQHQHQHQALPVSEEVPRCAAP